MLTSSDLGVLEYLHQATTPVKRNFYVRHNTTPWLGLLLSFFGCNHRIPFRGSQEPAPEWIGFAEWSVAIIGSSFEDPKQMSCPGSLRRQIPLQSSDPLSRIPSLLMPALVAYNHRTLFRGSQFPRHPTKGLGHLPVAIIGSPFEDPKVTPAPDPPLAAAPVVAIIGSPFEDPRIPPLFMLMLFIIIRSPFENLKTRRGPTGRPTIARVAIIGSPFEDPKVRAGFHVAVVGSLQSSDPLSRDPRASTRSRQA